MKHWWNDTDRGKLSREHWWNDIDRGKLSMEHWWNYIDRGKLKYWERNLSQCHFVHQKRDLKWTGMEPAPATNCIRHGTAHEAFC
jgi:hypothetical protein